MEPDFTGITIIEDKDTCDGSPLFLAYVKKFAKRKFKVIYVVDNDRLISNSKQFSEFSESFEILRIDDDALGWNASVSGAGILRNIDYFFQSIQQKLALFGDEEKAAVFIPCLSFLWTVFDPVDIVKFFVKLRNGTRNSSKIPIMASIRAEMLSNAEREHLKYAASLWISLSKVDEEKKSNDGWRFSVQSMQRKGPKCSEKALNVDVTSAFDLTSAARTSAPTPSLPIPTVDPTAGLTFNLRLKDEELSARKNVQLPHLAIRDNLRNQTQEQSISAKDHSKESGAKIIYTPDEADDFDDEDPDADLDI